MSDSRADVDGDGPPNRREQLVLAFLQDRGGSVTIGELTEGITEQVDEDAESATISGDIHETLYDHVLPDLDDRDLVDFDVERGVVSLATDTESGVLTRLLERMHR